MPELDIQRRQQPAVPWWVWLIGAVLLIGLIWWIVAEATDRDRAAVVPPEERVAGERQEAPVEPVTTVGAVLPLGNILENPSEHFGDSVSGTATVADVVSDRGFWVEVNGSRMFVLKDEALPEVGLEVNTGQQVQIQGTVRDTQQVAEAPGVADMEAETRRIIEDQPVYIHATDINVLERPETEPATP